eukprot:scaffold7902_cov129-Cylindrotheca_fusiformis.AAC.5
MDDHDSGFSNNNSTLLNSDCQVALIAEILSYLLESTRDLAKLRRVSKRWNSSVLPYCLRNEKCCVLKNCDAISQSPKFVEELVEIGGWSYAGRMYRLFPPPEQQRGEEDLQIFKFWVHRDDDERRIRPAEVTVDTMLIISDYEYENSHCATACCENQKDYSFVSDDTLPRRFAEYCKTMTETNSWDTLQAIGKKAVKEGMFVCIQDLEMSKRECPPIPLAAAEDLYHTTSVPVILTVKAPRHQLQILETSSCCGGGGGEDSFKIALLTGKTPRENEGYETCPFLKSNTINNPALLIEKESGEEEGFLYPTLAGYNVTEDDGIVTCQVPTAFEVTDDLTDFLWNSSSDYNLPLDNLWKKCQEQHAREGVAIADGIVPNDLHNTLMSQIDALSIRNQAIIEDYHHHPEHSFHNILKNIVDPSVYSFIKGVSPLSTMDDDEIRSLPTVISSGSSEEEEEQQINPSSPWLDYWGRPYEANAKYQWLPTYFDVAADGRCTVRGYINNIVPRAKHKGLYESLGQLFSQALPLIESVYSYCHVVQKQHLRINLEEIDSNTLSMDTPFEEVPVSLRGRQLQVVTKIVDYELSPGQSYEDVWHVDGMPHEEIVATAIYFMDNRDDEIEGGNLLFKRAFHRREAKYLSSCVFHTRPDRVGRIIHEGLQPLGQVESIPRRLVVYPNSHVHKMSKLENVLPDVADGVGQEKKRRRTIVFFLVNPERRIVSTREVPIQQEYAGGSMTWTEACEQRLKLMKERTLTKQDWNVREIQLREE